MRIGLVARADNSGLGMQTWEFAKHMNPAKTMVVDISKFNNNRQYPERYQQEGTVFINGFPQYKDIEEFLTDIDMVFVAEAPYDYSLYALARERGIKVAVQYNYEFFDWFANPHYPMPDMLIAPSKWHYSEIELFAEANNIQHIYLHCPVNRELLPYREIRQARTFIHNAGRAAAHDRNGTKTVIEASRFIKSDAKIVVRFQGEQGLAHQATNSFEDYIRMAHELGDTSKLQIFKAEYENYEDAYKTGDVMLFPRRYGGNCLPLNEALSVGMPVIMPDISPNNRFLHDEWLLPATKIAEFTPRTTIDIYDVNPELLAAKIDEMYNMTEGEMLRQNLLASNLGHSISWEVMKPQYVKAFEDLCTQS